jgi:hypothetical protein
MDSKMLIVFGLVLLVLGGAAFAFKMTNVVPYEAEEKYTETVPKEVPTVEVVQKTETKQVPYTKTETYTDYETVQVPYQDTQWVCDYWWGCWWEYTTKYRTEQKAVTKTRDVVDYRPETFTQNVPQNATKIIYEEVERTRTVTKYKEVTNPMPQYIGGGLALVGLLLIIAGGFMYATESRQQAPPPQQIIYQQPPSPPGQSPPPPSTRFSGQVKQKSKPPPKILR